MTTLRFRRPNSGDQDQKAPDRASALPRPASPKLMVGAFLLALAAVPTAAQSLVNWNIQITNAITLASPGTVVVFGAAITNASGTNLAFRNVSVFLDPEGFSTNWQVRLADTFLATQLVLPALGYRGPLFEVVVPADATNHPPVSGRLELALDLAQLPVFNAASPVAAPPTANVGFLVNPPALQIAVQGEALQLNWPSAAQTYRLETISNLSAPAVWAAITNRPTTLNFQNWLIVTNATSQGYFRLKQSSNPSP